MHCKRIRDEAELQKICAAARGLVAVPFDGGSVVHTLSCHVVAGAASTGVHDAGIVHWRWYASMADAARAAAPLVLCPECDPGLDDKTSALNRSGAFLHAEIYRVLGSLGYRTTAEHPVHVAPFVQDPSSRLRTLAADGYPVDPETFTVSAAFQRAMAESQQASLAKQRVLDIVATTAAGRSRELVLPVEVKKTDPGYVDWVFMKYNADQIDMTATLISTKRAGGLRLFEIPDSDLGCPALFVKRAGMGASQAPMGVYDGAVPLTLNKSSQYDFQKRSVDEAAVQVVEGTFGLITGKILRQVSTGIGYDTEQCYIPIVVTTANLYSCEYDPGDFDMSTGLASRAGLQKEEFLIYECPAPVTTSFPSQLTGLDRPEDVRPLTKWQVVVAQAKSLEKMLGVVRQAASNGG